MQRYRAKQRSQRKQQQINQEMTDLLVRLEEIRSKSAKSSANYTVVIAHPELPGEGIVDVVPDMAVTADEEDLCVSTANKPSDRNERLLSTDDVDILCNKMREVVNRHKVTHSCLNDFLATLRNWFPDLPKKCTHDPWHKN